MRAKPYCWLWPIAAIAAFVTTLLPSAAMASPQQGTTGMLIRLNSSEQFVGTDEGARAMFDDGSFYTDSGTDFAYYNFVRIASDIPNQTDDEDGLFQAGWFTLENPSGTKSFDNCITFSQGPEIYDGVIVEWKRPGLIYPYQCFWWDRSELPTWAIYGRAVFSIKHDTCNPLVSPCGLSTDRGWQAQLIDTQTGTHFCLMEWPYDCGDENGVLLGRSLTRGYAAIGTEHILGLNAPSYSETQLNEDVGTPGKLGSFEVLPFGTSTWTTVQLVSFPKALECDGANFDWFASWQYHSGADANEGTLRWNDTESCP